MIVFFYTVIFIFSIFPYVKNEQLLSVSDVVALIDCYDEFLPFPESSNGVNKFKFPLFTERKVEVDPDVSELVRGEWLLTCVKKRTKENAFFEVLLTYFAKNFLTQFWQSKFEKKISEDFKALMTGKKICDEVMAKLREMVGKKPVKNCWHPVINAIINAWKSVISYGTKHNADQGNYCMKVMGELKDLKEKPPKATYVKIENIRKHVNAFDLAFKIQYHTIAVAFIEKLLETIDARDNEVTEKYEKKLENLRKEIKNLGNMLEDKAAHKYFQFNKVHKTLVGNIKAFLGETLKIEVGENEDSKMWMTAEKDDEASVGRTLWFVRHSEREDNVNKMWNNDTHIKYKNTRKLQWDNSMLSKRGLEQARRLAPQFKEIFANDEKSHSIFVSPFERTIETAIELLGDQTHVKIKIEAGITERRDMMYKGVRDGFQNIADYPANFREWIDESYKPVYDRTNLVLESPDGDEEALLSRVKKTLVKILEKHNEDNLVFVSHGATIAGAHQVLTGLWSYIGQSSVSKFVEIDGKGSNKFRLEYSSDMTHLAEDFDYELRAESEKHMTPEEFYKKHTTKNF